MDFICPTCKRPTHPTDNEIIEYLAKEIDRYTEVLIIRTKELDRAQKALDVAKEALKWIHETYNLGMGYEAAIMEKCEFALEQIKTALEQKDKK